MEGQTLRSNLTPDRSLGTIEAFCDAQIICRFIRPPIQQDTLVLAIPGGPGLSNLYLDPFMCAVSKLTGANVALMDLPNHGSSIVNSSSTFLSYPECKELVRRAIEEIREQVGSLILFGQSFGARLVFDILNELQDAPQATILTGFPYKFEISSDLEAKLETLPLEPDEGEDVEKIRAKNWKQILSLYVARPISEEGFAALAVKEDVAEGHLMLQGASPIQTVADGTVSLSSVTIFEGGLDIVVPDENWTRLRGFLPNARFVTLDDVGHFPMLEAQGEVLSAFSNIIGKTMAISDHE